MSCVWRLARKTACTALTAGRLERAGVRIRKVHEVLMDAASVGVGAVPRGRRVLPIVALGLALVIALLAGGAYLYDHSRRDVIANGVRIDGVAVGGLHETAARAKIERDLVAPLQRAADGSLWRAHVDTRWAPRGRARGRRQHGLPGAQRESGRIDLLADRARGVRRQRQPRRPAGRQLLARGSARAHREGARCGQPPAA